VCYLQYESDVFARTMWPNVPVQALIWPSGSKPDYEVNRKTRTGDHGRTNLWFSLNRSVDILPRLNRVDRVLANEGIGE
jgi:hypothetical protein